MKIRVLMFLTLVLGALLIYSISYVTDSTLGTLPLAVQTTNQPWERFDSLCWLAITNSANVTYLPAKYNSTEIQMEVSENCTEFSRHLTSTTHVTDLERDFPIAFSILVYRDPEQAVRLLRAIWRPQNVYCIHVDSKSHPDVLSYIKSRVTCFDNVFLAPRMINVYWGRFSVLEADLICMEALYNHKTKWKYFINLTGQEFPLKTNYELVRILKFYAGGNDIYGVARNLNRDRIKNLGPAPHGITPVKGPIHSVASRGFVDFTLHHRTAKDFLQWAKRMHVPDETYFTSLNNNPHLQAPGSVKRTVEETHPQILGFFNHSRVRYKIFIGGKHLPKCRGKIGNGVCIFGVGDLPNLVDAPHLFANKFHYRYQPFAYNCLERWLFKKYEREKKGKFNFDLSPYKNLYFMNNCQCDQQKE